MHNGKDGGWGPAASVGQEKNKEKKCSKKSLHGLLLNCKAAALRKNCACVSPFVLFNDLLEMQKKKKMLTDVFV